MGSEPTPAATPETPAPSASAEPKPLPWWQALLEKPRVAAAIVLAGLFVWPTWDLVITLQKGGSVTLPVTMYGVFVFIPAAIWFGWRPAFLVAQYILGIGATWYLVQAVFLQNRPAFIPGALLTAVFFWIGSKHDPAAPKKEAQSDAEQTLAWTRENVEAIAVAFIMALIIRCFCIEVFQIPSSSMEPRLLGGQPDHDPDSCEFKNYHITGTGGDRIMVTKYYYALTPVERFDIVVFKFPLNQAKNFIKRVVGLPEETIFIQHGNIWFQKHANPDSKGFQIARRPLDIQQAVWIDLLKVDRIWTENMSVLRDEDTFKERFDPTSRDGRYATHEIANNRLRTIRKDGSPASRFLVRGAEHSASWEFRIGMNVELEGPGTFDLHIANEFGKFTMHLATDGESKLTWDGAERQTINFEPIAAGERHRVELLVYDGIVQALVDGRVKRELEYFRYYQDIKPVSPGRQVWFGSEDATYLVSDIAVGRDIAYSGKHNMDEGPEGELKIGRDQYVMMGDNVANSHDSRAWRQYTFKLKGDRTYRCESQGFKEGSSSEARKWAEENGIKDEPAYLIVDEHGVTRPIYRKEIIEQDGRSYADDPAPFVDRRFIVGKALWIWWPPGRWGRLIK